MVNFTILAGGYTSFIASYLFNSDASSLTLLAQAPTGENPSWIISHPTNSSILYATNEVTQGMLQSYVVDSGGFLTGPIDQISSRGDGPAFCGPINETLVAVWNFGSGDGRIVPTTADPDQFNQHAQAPLISFPTPPANHSHPHMSLPFNDEVFVADLGGDTIWRLAQQSPGNFQIHGSIPQPAGSGPRHFAIQDNFIYVLHETSSTLTVQQIPDPKATASLILAQASIIPHNNPTGSQFAAAEILIPPTTPDFPNSLIYVSNRNIGSGIDPRGDTIAIFEHVHATATTPDSLNLVAQVFTGLDQIRGMEIGRVEDGGVEFLVASGFAGTGGVVVFQRVDEGRNLVEMARNKDVLTRTSFVWV